MKQLIILAFLFMSALCPASLALAQDWRVYESPYLIYKTRVPDNIQESARFFPISDTQAAMIGSAHADIDQNPYKEAVKNYVIQYVHSIGPRLVEDEDIARMIKDELDIYARHYGSMQGSIETRDDVIFQSGIPGGEIKMSYNDPEYGKQSIRARVFFTGHGKVEQLITGPPQSMHSMTTQAYFDTMQIDEGYRPRSKTYIEEAQEIISPLGIFTLYLPQVMEPYFPVNYSVRSSDTVERISAQFYDPIWKEYVIYNVYGYKMPGKITYLSAEGILQENHILRHRFKSEAVDIGRFTNNGQPVLKTNYTIVPNDEYPYIKNVRLRAQFFDDAMVVHEVMASPNMINSTFLDTIIHKLAFHPEKYVAP